MSAHGQKNRDAGQPADDGRSVAIAHMLKALEILDTIECGNAACHLSLAIEDAGGEVPAPAADQDQHWQSC